jgi:uncharacterized OsmC-like protein
MSVDRPNEGDSGQRKRAKGVGVEQIVDDIGRALVRLEAAVAQRPGFGVGTSHSVTTLGEGLRCTTVEGAWSTESDLLPAIGGGGSAPTPNVLMRAALGSCMAITYRLRAARHGVELTSVRVTVESDSALAGMLSCDAAAPPGYTEVRYHVEVESPDDPARVLAILDEGDRLSPVLDVLNRATAVRRTTEIRPGAIQPDES